ncbi:MAG: hypothetical protein MZU95_12835 [Desulfomicrobium escambiense]|nr:hypothetical protein [Desulfomicrobium escambiense]
MRLLGLLPDRLGLHPLRAGAGHPGGPGPRLGRRQPRRPTPAHHRRRPARSTTCSSSASSTPSASALPDIDIDFCERRRGEVIEYVTREVRPRERRADHHLRHHEGEGRRARRRARAWTCRYADVDQHRQA